MLYRDDRPYYIGKAGELYKRLRHHALRPNARHYNFWNYFSAFKIEDGDDRGMIEAILISAMPTANSSRPKLDRKRVGKQEAKMLNRLQARMLNGAEDQSGEPHPEATDEDDD